MKKTLLICLLPFLTFVACNNQPSKEDSIEKINKLESQVFAQKTAIVNMELANSLVKEYELFAESFKGDSLAPNYLFKAGEILMNIKSSEQAIMCFGKIVKEYPKYGKVGDCVFLQAFIYETQLNNIDQAKGFYEKFLKDYPNHQLADDAKASIDNLGKSLEDIVKGFEEKAAQDSVK